MNKPKKSPTQFRIVQNHDRKTITVLFSGVRFFSAIYLLNLYVKEGDDVKNGRYFGQGILDITTEERNQLLKELASNLNALDDKVKVNPRMFYATVENDFPLIKPHTNKDDSLSGYYELALSVFAKGNPRFLFFEDKARTRTVVSEQVIKEHEWVVELEIKSYIDENTLETKLFTVLHRIVKGKKINTSYSSNDEAWDGFDFETGDDDSATELGHTSDIITDDDLPF